MISSVISSTVNAQENTPEKTIIIKKFEENGGITNYLGTSYGLDGWFLIDENKNAQYAYTTPEGATLLGMLFDPNGESETINQLKKLKEKKSGLQKDLKAETNKSDNPSEVIYNKFANASWIHVGNKTAPYFYAIIDVNSKESRNLLKNMQSYIKNNKVAIRLIPIASSKDSFYKTAQIVSTNNQAETIEKYMMDKEVSLPKT